MFMENKPKTKVLKNKKEIRKKTLILLETILNTLWISISKYKKQF